MKKTEDNVDLLAKKYNEKEFDEEEDVYEDLDFANAILYRTAIYINSNGREVGNPDAEFSIPIPTGTGLWELDAFDDEFGDKTNEKYIRLTGKGVFSNSAATHEKLIGHLFLDKERISFRLIEYGSHVVKEDTEICYFKIKARFGYFFFK